jgi:glycerol-3-phosphate acyltransferase PlsY
VATAGGALTVLYPLIALALALVWVVVARVLHKASIASLLITVLFPIAVASTGHDLWEDIVVSALAIFVVARHAPNIRRLMRRQEMDLGAGSSS